MTADRCGTCHPPADETADREALDRFATFLRIIEDAPVDEDGRRHIGPRAYAYAHGIDVDPMGCTGLAASWCPRHGSCQCPDPADALDDPACPLHAPMSDHPWPDEAELPRPTPAPAP